MTRVKICGITNRDDAVRAVSLGAWALGFIFYRKSPRCVTPGQARRIIASLPPLVTPVGVFVNHTEKKIKEIADRCRLNTLQFHGDEAPSFCRRFKNYKIIKAIRVGENFDEACLTPFKVDAFLFDSYHEKKFGGTGKSFDWMRIKNFKSIKTPVILSGGLNPGNVQEAISMTQPFAIDASSGVEESPGKKSGRLLEEFFTKVNSSKSW